MADSILERRDQINVIVTTYDLAAKKEDNKFMRRLRPDVCVYDEGMIHFLLLNRISITLALLFLDGPNPAEGILSSIATCSQ
jgi:hypothetical protein